MKIFLHGSLPLPLSTLLLALTALLIDSLGGSLWQRQRQRPSRVAQKPASSCRRLTRRLTSPPPRSNAVRGQRSRSALNLVNYESGEASREALPLSLLVNCFRFQT